jgi:hypothetical protein
MLSNQLSTGVQNMQIWMRQKTGNDSSMPLPNANSLLNGTITFVSGTVINLILIPVYTILLRYKRIYSGAPH